MHNLTQSKIFLQWNKNSSEYVNYMSYIKPCVIVYIY